MTLASSLPLKVKTASKLPMVNRGKGSKAPTAKANPATKPANNLHRMASRDKAKGKMLKVSRVRVNAKVNVAKAKVRANPVTKRVINLPKVKANKASRDKDRVRNKVRDNRGKVAKARVKVNVVKALAARAKVIKSPKVAKGSKAKVVKVRDKDNAVKVRDKAEATKSRKMTKDSPAKVRVRVAKVGVDRAAAKVAKDKPTAKDKTAPNRAMARVTKSRKTPPLTNLSMHNRAMAHNAVVVAAAADNAAMARAAQAMLRIPPIWRKTTIPIM